MPRLRRSDDGGDVLAVVEDIPEEANCYHSFACPGHEKEYAEAKSRAAERLATFTSTALEAATHPASECYVDLTGPIAEKNLQSLKDLRVVSFGELVLEKPMNNPNCYNLPCDEDRRAADEINHDRARRLAAIKAALRTQR